MSDWYSCEHEWKELIDSIGHGEYFTDVECTKCGCPGQKTNKTGEVYWPAT